MKKIVCILLVVMLVSLMSVSFVSCTPKDVKVDPTPEVTNNVDELEPTEEPTPTDEVVDEVPNDGGEEVEG